ncbi:uncharacterized protein LOC125655898 [Ostrea edulis]|uniref:uncharacterized protein LOC125655898 n=1 Tax=Ostrea edulis TaxID=37623 RepID=UPI0020941FBF|nr:uncharacterized protein LOC125655898 [Ostrea edulis]
MDFRFSVVLVCVYNVCNIVQGYTSNLKFDSDCDDYNTRTIFSDDVYYVQWSGTSLSDTCSYQFSPFDTDYKVCVEATSFYISSCQTHLKYYGGIIASDLKHSYSCYDPTPIKYCGGTYDDVKIRLTTASSPSLLRGYFTLKVTTKNGNQVGIIAGSVVGSIVFAIIVIAVIVVICQRRRRYGTPGLIVSPANQPQVVTSTSAYSGGVVNPNYPNSAPYNCQNNPGTGSVMNSYPPPYSAASNHPPPYTGSTTPYPNPGQNNAYPSGYPNQLPNNQI